MLARLKGSISIQIVIAMVIGVAFGVFLGKKAAPLGELGQLVIRIVKAAAAPLLFFSVCKNAITVSIPPRAALRAVAIATFNCSLAMTIGLCLSNAIRPGDHMANLIKNGATKGPAQTLPNISLVRVISGFVPTSFVAPFVGNDVLQIVVVALLISVATRRALSEPETSESAQVVLRFVMAGLRIFEIVLTWCVHLVPVAVCGVVAKAVGDNGIGPLKGLIWYVGVSVLGLVLHIVIVYHGWLLVLRFGLRRFWERAKVPVIYSAGANSSLATLPLTLTALRELGVKEVNATIGAAVLTNFNNDGIVLYEGMAVIAIAQAHGIALSLSEQLTCAFYAMLAAIGIAGVPEAGFVSLSLVLQTTGLPADLLPLCLTVDWTVARVRSIVNVLSDLLVSIILDQWEARGGGAASDGREEGGEMRPLEEEEGQK